MAAKEPQDECPFCGEPIDVDADFCPHCGSDAETGWNPDADYESLELPEDDEPAAEPPQPGPEEVRAQLSRMFGPALVAGTWVLFVAYGSSQLPPGVILIPAAYLAVCIVAISRLAPRSRPAAR